MSSASNMNVNAPNDNIDLSNMDLSDVAPPPPYTSDDDDDESTESKTTDEPKKPTPTTDEPKKPTPTTDEPKKLTPPPSPPPIPQQHQQQQMNPRMVPLTPMRNVQFQQQQLPQQQQQQQQQDDTMFTKVTQAATSTVRNIFNFNRKASQNFNSPQQRSFSNKEPTEPIMLKPPTDKATDPNKAILAMLVDRSGSMDSMGSEVSGGCNEYLDTQRESDEEHKTNTHVIFSVFDSSYDLVRSKPLKETPKVTDADVQPRGSTALFDSIARSVADTIEQISSMETAPGQVGVFILTDGAENSSQTWSKTAIAKQIKLLEAAPYNWQFYFAAANQDAMATGSSIGMSTDRCMTYGNSPENMKSAFKSSGQAFARQKRAMSSAYTPTERSSCQKY